MFHLKWLWDVLISIGVWIFSGQLDLQIWSSWEWSELDIELLLWYKNEFLQPELFLFLTQLCWPFSKPMNLSVLLDFPITSDLDFFLQNQGHLPASLFLYLWRCFFSFLLLWTKAKAYQISGLLATASEKKKIKVCSLFKHHIFATSQQPWVLRPKVWEKGSASHEFRLWSSVTQCGGLHPFFSL